MTTPTPRDLHRLALELACGAALRVHAAGDGRTHDDRPDSVSTKSTPTDLVTATDRDTESWLVAEIQRERPGDAVLGEEGGPRRATDGSRVRWVLDPIDGTVNFVLGLPQYAVSVAAELDGDVVAGAVANPATGEVFHAHSGGGAWLRHMNGDITAGGEVTTAGDITAGSEITKAGGLATDDRPLHGPRSVPLDRAVLATGFGYDAARRARQIAVVAALLPRIGDVRRLGAAALDLCYVAAGRLDGYFEAGLNPWDHAAGGLIAQEAGCVVSGIRGRRASERLVVAAGPALIDRLITVLTELGADTVLDD